MLVEIWSVTASLGILLVIYWTGKIVATQIKVRSIVDGLIKLIDEMTNDLDNEDQQ